MKRRNLFIVIFFFTSLIVSIGIILANFNYKKGAQVCFNNHCFNVELAITPEEKNRGLMFRKLDLYGGMLFVFKEEGEYSFWMKNTSIPLDIVWIDKNNEVVFISENAQPCKESFCQKINPYKNAKYVLEVNGGISKSINLTEGDKISLVLNNRHFGDFLVR